MYTQCCVQRKAKSSAVAPSGHLSHPPRAVSTARSRKLTTPTPLTANAWHSCSTTTSPTCKDATPQIPEPMSINNHRRAATPHQEAYNAAVGLCCSQNVSGSGRDVQTGPRATFRSDAVTLNGHGRYCVWLARMLLVSATIVQRQRATSSPLARSRRQHA